MKLLFHAVVSCALVVLPGLAHSAEPVRLILDTDMSGDCDDAGALALLHALADQGKCQILAIVTNRKDLTNASAAAVDAINTYYGRPDIPIGTDKQAPTALQRTSTYTRALRDEYPTNIGPDDRAPDALDVYRQTLKAQPDGSVVICSDGSFSNLADLCRSEPALVRAKVKQLVVMGGHFPHNDRPETNIATHPVAAAFVAEHWPGEIIWHGFEVGVVLITGGELRATPPKNPVRRSYELKPFGKRPAIEGGQPSWDQGAALYAVCGPQPEFWELVGPGRVSVDVKGVTNWKPDAKGQQYYVHIVGKPDRLAAAIEALMVAPPAARPRAMAPSAHKHLVFDTRAVTATANAQLVLGTVRKEPRNPLFRADRPWENALNNLYPNVLWDEDDGVFKLWYKCVLATPEAIAKMDQPSTVHNVGWYLLYATSTDGLAWHKPALGLHRYDGRDDTNIVARDTPNVGVFKDLHDPNASRRYKMVYDVGLGKPRVRFSPDGIHWSEPQEPRGFGAQNGDTHNNAFWDQRLGKYLWFTKLYQGERLVARLESDDFLNWRNSGLVLRSTAEEGRACQTYCLPVFRYANVYLGYVMMYGAGRGRMVDCELAWSPDSVAWQRLAPGKSFIPRGAAGSYDSKCIYAMSGPAIAQGGDLLIFYGGSDALHTGWARHCLPCLARLPIDHFAGYEPADRSKPATFTTASLVATDRPLRLTADAAGGSLRVWLLDSSGRTVAESEPITADGIDMVVSWKPGASLPAPGQPVQLRFELVRGKLWSFDGPLLAGQAQGAGR